MASRNRIAKDGFLARAATRNPDAQWPVGRVRRDHLRNNGFGQRIKRDRVAKKLRDIDQQVLGKAVEFTGVCAKLLNIKARVRHARGLHAALDPAG